jgi:hypothetical protein
MWDKKQKLDLYLHHMEQYHETFGIFDSDIPTVSYISCQIVIIRKNFSGYYSVQHSSN